MATGHHDLISSSDEKQRKPLQPRVLIVAGSDSGGGAGIQADIKTVAALGGYATTAVTALTAQNTKGVHGIQLVEPDFVRSQMIAVLSDIGADTVKTGMLPTQQIVKTVADVLSSTSDDLPLVIDPVMASKWDQSFMDREAIQALKQFLLPKATLITPNLNEASCLTSTQVQNVEDMQKAAKLLRRMGAKAVLVKGGHLKSDQITDVLIWEAGEELFETKRIHSNHTHGTGCTLASAIATYLAQKMPLNQAVLRAKEYLLEAIRSAPRIGKGQGPLNHGHLCCPWPLR